MIPKHETKPIIRNADTHRHRRAMTRVTILRTQERNVVQFLKQALLVAAAQQMGVSYEKMGLFN